MVPLEHTEDVSLVHLSTENHKPRDIVSICGQCHLRGRESASTGLPYANQFVAGDDLFRVGSEREIKAQNLMRKEHKDYVVQDGDILHILAST